MDALRQHLENFAPNVRCEERRGRGRVLVAAHGFQCGDVVLKAKPLLSIGLPVVGSQAAMLFEKVSAVVAERDIGTVWGALHSLLINEVPEDWPLPTCALAVQTHALMLHSSGRQPTNWTKWLKKTCQLLLPAVKLEQLLDVWEMNCFGDGARDDALYLFFEPALANHSCLPTVSWYVHEGVIYFKAIAELAAGDEITDSYIKEENLVASTPFRRRKLHESGKAFECFCERCETSDRSRGVPCPHCSTGVIYLAAEIVFLESCAFCGHKLSLEDYRFRLQCEIAAEKQLPYVVDSSGSLNHAYLEDALCHLQYLGKTTHWQFSHMRGIICISD